MKFQTRFDRQVDPGLVCDPAEGMTKSSFKKECDINEIMKKYLQKGQLPDLIKQNPEYGDFSDVPSYQEALNRVSRAEQVFAALPAAVREECANDPAVFLQKVQDATWAVKQGLAVAKPTPSKADSSGAGGQPAPTLDKKEGSANVATHSAAGT